MAHSSPIVIAQAASTITAFLATNSLFAENEAKFLQLEEELSTAVRDVVAGRDDLDTEFLEDDEVHTLGSLALRVESLARSNDMSKWMDDDEDGKQSSMWNILLSLASRGGQGRKEEEWVSGSSGRYSSLTIPPSVGRSLPPGSHVSYHLESETTFIR